MNGLRVCNSLLHDCGRVVYSIPGVVGFRGFINVNNTQIQFFRKFGATSIAALSTNSTSDKLPPKILSTKNVSVGKKDVYLHQNKTRVLVASQSGGNCGFIRRSNFSSNFVLTSVSRGEFNRFHSQRNFSDDSAPITVIPELQITGIWKTISESVPVEFCQNALVWLHCTTGLPWWATIVLATWGIRTVVTLPLALYQYRILAKVENLKFEMDEMVKVLKVETNYAVEQFKWTENYARAVYNRSLKKQWQMLLERDNCHPMKAAILIIVQIPMWVTLSTSIRNLCFMMPYRNESAHAIYLELTTGGFGWITNLTQVDNSFVIPITLGLLNLTIIEMQCMMKLNEPSRTQRYVTNFFRLVAVGMVPLSAYVPAAMSLYWTSSSAFGVIQNFITMSPRVRRFAGVPLAESEIDGPYRHLYDKIRDRLNLKDMRLPHGVKKL